MTKQQKIIIEAAIAYGKAGRKLLPLVEGTKQPYINWVHEKDGRPPTPPSSEEKIIRGWWKRWPNAGIGIPVGEYNDIFGGDGDYDDALRGGGDEAILALYEVEKQLEKDGAIFTKSPTKVTVGGKDFYNFHAFFKYPGKMIKNGGTIAPYFTSRSTGYIFVLPPTPHPKGGNYTPKGKGLASGTLMECPSWIIEAAEKPEEKDTSEVSFGDRHAALKRRACALRFFGKTAEYIFEHLKNYRNLHFDNPEDKTDEEIRKIVEWAMRKLEPKEAKQYQDIGLKIIMETCIDSDFKLRSTEEIARVYHVLDWKKREVIEVPDPLYANRIISENIYKLFGPINEEVKTIRAAFSKWKIKALNLPKDPNAFSWPAEVTFPVDPYWSYRQIPFVPTKGIHPAWDSFLNRLSSPEEFKAFVWSIFEEDNRSRQFLYLYGKDGEEGKSVVLKVFYDLFGKAAVGINNSMTSSESGKRWLPSLLLGKQLAIWADCKNPKFAMSEMLRNMVSGDPITVERKGEQPFTAVLRVRLMIGSNYAPEISGEGANTSRLIRIDVSRSADRSGDWKEQLELELPFFLHSCREVYRQLCPSHGDIPLGKRALELSEDATGNIDSEFDHILHRLKFGPNESCQAKDLYDLCRRDLRLSSNEMSNAKQLLERKYNVFKKPIIKKGRPKQWRYFGVSVRSIAEDEFPEKDDL